MISQHHKDELERRIGARERIGARRLGRISRSILADAGEEVDFGAGFRRNGSHNPLSRASPSTPLDLRFGLELAKKHLQVCKLWFVVLGCWEEMRADSLEKQQKAAPPCAKISRGALSLPQTSGRLRGGFTELTSFLLEVGLCVNLKERRAGHLADKSLDGWRRGGYQG